MPETARPGKKRRITQAQLAAILRSVPAEPIRIFRQYPLPEDAETASEENCRSISTPAGHKTQQTRARLEAKTELACRGTSCSRHRWAASALPIYISDGLLVMPVDLRTCPAPAKRFVDRPRLAAIVTARAHARGRRCLIGVTTRRLRTLRLGCRSRGRRRGRGSDLGRAAGTSGKCRLSKQSRGQRKS